MRFSVEGNDAEALALLRALAEVNNAVVGRVTVYDESKMSDWAGDEVSSTACRYTATIEVEEGGDTFTESEWVQGRGTTPGDALRNLGATLHADQVKRWRERVRR